MKQPAPRHLPILLAVAALAAGARAKAQSAADSPPLTQCLGVGQGKAAIVDDSKEPGSYFDQMQPMEMAAKTGAPMPGADIKAQRQVCRERYQAGVLAFTPGEQAALEGYVRQLQKELSRDYPAFAATPWRFIKLADRIEGGLPHTRGTCIVLSAGLCRFMAMLGPLPPGHPAHREMLGLLLHEQMHVFQRAHTPLFDSLYAGVWGFEKAKNITPNPWLTEHHLANPDGTDCCWVMPIKRNGTTDHIWPLVVLCDGDGPKRMPEDFQMLAVALAKNGDGFAVKTEADGHPQARDLMSDADYAKPFGGSTNTYHPHEAAADLFARMVMWDCFPLKDHAPSPKMGKALAPFRAWCKTHLQTPGGETAKGTPEAQ